MGQLYIHIGRGKTGTTAAQRYFWKHRKALADRGVHYLTATDPKGGGHQSLAKCFIKSPPEYMELNFDRSVVLDQVQKELSSVRTEIVLVSSENFTMASPDQVFAYFGESLPGWTAKILFLARSQDELAESEFNQMVKWTGETRRFADFVADGIDELHFDELLEPWRAVVGTSNMRVDVYNSAARDCVSQLLSLMGLAGIGHNQSSTQENISIGAITTELFRLLNNQKIDSRRELFARIFEITRGIDVPPLYFSSEEARDFRKKYAESNRRFSERYLEQSREDLGCRRYSDEERDQIIRQLESLKGARSQ